MLAEMTPVDLRDPSFPTKHWPFAGMFKPPRKAHFPPHKQGPRVSWGAPCSSAPSLHQVESSSSILPVGPWALGLFTTSTFGSQRSPSTWGPSPPNYYNKRPVQPRARSSLHNITPSISFFPRLDCCRGLRSLLTLPPFRDTRPHTHTHTRSLGSSACSLVKEPRAKCDDRPHPMNILSLTLPKVRYPCGYPPTPVPISRQSIASRPAL